MDSNINTDANTDLNDISNDIKSIIKDIIDNSPITFGELSQQDTLDCIINICTETFNQIYSLNDNDDSLIPPLLITQHCETELNRLKSYDEIIYLSLVNREDHTTILTKKKLNAILKQIKYLKNLKQYEQKSPEWFAHRLSMITASDLALAIGKSKYKSNLNNLILRKCGADIPYIGSRATRHGVKYEDVAVLLYEKRNNVAVEEYGCIRHKNISYIGASPDGICGVDSNNKKLIGRMLEIKCPYSREITGIPLLGYTIQVQGQLEVCNLEYCDFLECKISEYKTHENYFNDTETKDKGSIIEIFDTTTKQTQFFYSKIGINKEEFNNWADKIFDDICNDPKLEYTETTFWKLEKYSCVLLKRNKGWFNKILPDIKAFWDQVLNYKKNGWEELLKKKKTYKKTIKVPKYGFYEDDDNTLVSSQIKIVDIDTDNKNSKTNSSKQKKSIKKTKKKKQKKKLKLTKTKPTGPPKVIVIT